MPENTTDDGSQEALKKKELETEELKVAVEKEKKKVENAELLVTKWSNEVGDIRELKKEFETAIIEAKKTVEGMEKKVKEASEGNKEDTSSEENFKNLEDVEAGLSDEQRKIGVELFKNFSEAEKIQYADDPKFRVKFAARVKKGTPIVPESPWNTAEEEAKKKEMSGVDSILDRVFKKKQQASFVPRGPRASFEGGASGDDKPEEFVEDTRVH